MLNEFYKQLPEQTTEETSWFVDVADGHSVAGGGDGSSGNPFASVSDITVRTINHNCTLVIYTDGQLGVVIYNTSDEYKMTYTRIDTCTCKILMQDMDLVKVSTIESSLVINDCTNVELHNIHADASPSTDANQITIDNSKVSMRDCIFDTEETYAMNIVNSEVSIQGCTFDADTYDIIMSDSSTLYDIGTNTYTSYSTEEGSQIVTVDSLSEVSP
jgi:hypothetical protein